MLLGELIDGLGIRLNNAAQASVRICDITEDSRTVLPGSLFIARAGVKADGRRFIAQALKSGAAGVLTDTSIAATPRADCAWLTADDVALAEARLAERFYGAPASKLTMIGATGTNGKTTVTHLIYQLLNAADVRCGLIGTVTVDDGGAPAKASMTTPPALELSYSLARMVESRYKACAMEASSHAIEQQRVAGVGFDVAIFTNLTGDHLDYHGTMENYTGAKARLFESLAPGAVAIVNADDAAHGRMTRNCRARVLRCSLERGDVECRAASGRMAMAGTPITLRGPWGGIEGSTRLIGAFNIMNCLQAAAAAHAAGVSRDDIALSLHALHAPPGRLETVTRGRRAEEFAVFVDYAHSDDSLAKALGAVRPLLEETGGRLRVVFGCGGDRDRTKRPRMGSIAAELADEVIVTSDNPRTEVPDAIIREIMSGIDGESRPRIAVDPDRRAAIQRAIGEAQPGDVVLIAGKGHEDYQLISDGAGGITRLDFDDRTVARGALVQRYGPGKAPPKSRAASAPTEALHP